MNPIETFRDIPLEQWVEIATRHRDDGFRLVQMTGTARPDHFEIMISFDKDYACVNYRVQVPRDRPELPSLGAIFPASFTYENELKDLFGFSIPGLMVDYGGHFLRTKTKIPFSGNLVLKKGGKTAPPTAREPTVAAPDTRPHPVEKD